MWFELNQCQRRELRMEGIECRFRLAVKIYLRAFRLVFLGCPGVWEHPIDHKHTKNHPELGPKQKAEYPEGPDENLQISDGTHHNIVAEGSRSKVKASVPERQAYKCVKTVAAIYFVAGRITLCILCVTTARCFTVIRIVADDNDALVGALGSELASGTSGECVAVSTRRARCDAGTGRVQGHHRQGPTGVGRYVCSDSSFTGWGSR